VKSQRSDLDSHHHHETETTTVYSAPGDRTDLDEALFANQASFPPPPAAPALPEEVAQSLQAEDPCSAPATSVPCGPGMSVVTYGVAVETALPPELSWDQPPVVPRAAEPRAVIGGTSYELASVLPGLFEVRQAETDSGWSAPPADNTSAEELPPLAEPLYPEELPPAAEGEDPEEGTAQIDPLRPVDAMTPTEAQAEEVTLAPLPPRPQPVLAVNTGMSIAPGETMPITPAHLKLTGGEPCLLDVMVLSPPVHGALLRDGFALTGGDVFTQEDIDQGRLHYRHDGGPQEHDSFTFATPEGEVPATVFAVTVTALHSAPELLGDGQLAGVLGGCRVDEILDGVATCCEPDLHAGLAIIGVSGRGHWHYSLDGGVSWLDLSEVHHARAVLLRHQDRLRFVPRAGWSGSVKLIYHAWDQTTGEAGTPANLAHRNASGGTTAFSKAIATAVLSIAPPPPQPVSDVEPWTAMPTLAEVMGTGLAVVRVVGAGTWQFSTDDGRSWHCFGSVYHGRARLLRQGDRVRFVPRRSGGGEGKVILSGRPWGGYGGNAGETISLGARRSYGEGTPFGEFVKTRTWHLDDG
jgi:hypothetical protein